MPRRTAAEPRLDDVVHRGRTRRWFTARVRRLAKKRGGVLLSPMYLGEAEPLQFRCAEGHTFRREPGHLLRGQWCPGCRYARAGATHRAPYARRFIAIIAERGGTLLSPGYAGSGKRHRFRCANGHEWTTVAGAILHGSWCRRCAAAKAWDRAAPKRRAVIRRLEAIVGKRGGRILPPGYVRGIEPIGLECARGHRWKTHYQRVELGAWCQRCKWDDRLARIREVIAAHGGELLTPSPRRGDHAMDWRCAEGHRFRMTASHVLHGQWCGRCRRAGSGMKKRAVGEAKLRRVVEERGGALVSPRYLGSIRRHRFRCAAGHEWTTSAGSVMQGSWCRVCYQSARRERDTPTRARIARRVDAIARQRGGSVPPPGYLRAGDPFEVRCGRGHLFKTKAAYLVEGIWCAACKAEDVLETLRSAARERGGRLLSQTLRPTPEPMDWVCEYGHRFRRDHVQVKRGLWCPRCRGRQRYDLALLRRLAKSRGGECLSTRCAGANSPHRWRCREGHEWEAPPTEVAQGHWCKVCGWWKPYSRVRLSIEVMRRTAEERGGRCLSEQYFGNKFPLRWRCARGHTWIAHPNRIRQGAWCPVCARSRLASLATMNDLAVSRGGRCLTKSWLQRDRPLTFECQRGHRFDALATVVRTGVWCPTCRDFYPRMGT